ncbi:diguanylate cyclase (GGDEF)-like protein [Hoeflea halophila]|uniref:Diguanylate cyclase (GGDEF)-like protein n=2 Tax=Hoeflea halophila TaxID=714899 RepID=A0A286IG51_9HYPH|nr:diguanylate cyclase (GGDEF)-like protein [Hoeflea halophila]
MNLRSGSGAIVNVLVNASPISTGGNSVNGALVTFKDVTVIERKNQDLSLAYAKLQKSESEIAKQNSQLKYLASHDPLTSCLNRRSFFEEFQLKYEASATTGQPLMCLMIDIDHFKSVNDTYGHGVGDSVIKGLALLLRQTCGKSDIVGRYGGEEFCMLLDGADESGAAEVAEYLRQEVKAQSSLWLGNDRSLSISIGIAPADLDAGSVNNAVDHADQALYAAKESGRDRAIQWRTDSFARVVTDEVDQTKKTKATKQDGSRVRSSNVHSISIETFVERLEISIDQSKRNQNSVSVICVSVDSLEEQVSGDDPEMHSRILGSVDKGLRSIIQDSEFVSLMPGNESASLVKLDDRRFLIAIGQIEDPTSVSWIMQRLAEQFPVPANTESGGEPIRFSLGASLYPRDGLNSEELIERAVLAQKKALETGGNKAFRMFAADMTDANQDQLLIEKGIRDAIERNEFSLHFQPIVDLVTGEVACAEVLLRSSNAYLQGISIGVVIQVAEKTGLIHELSSYVFKTTFSIINGWKNSGLHLPLISINLSAEQLKSEDVVIDLLDLVEAHQIDAAMIQFEMTETAMVTDIERTSDILRTLQNYGFHIALDDFGTGQSSLSHLLNINPDTIKIDRSFIHSLTTNRTNQLLVSTINELSRKIGAKVVAEGVETQEQLTMLMEIGCPYVQGYWLSRPLPAQVFEDWLLLFSADKSDMTENVVSSASGANPGQENRKYSFFDKGKRGYSNKEHPKAVRIAR